MLKFLPVGFVGLMVGGLIAANSSTILTHLNWGSSYLVHDFYRRFINPTATEKHYVNTGRVCTVLLYIFAALLSTVMSSAQQAFQILLSIGAGTGLLYIVRWFWSRVSAWCEVTAMAASLISAAGFPYLEKIGVLPHLGFAQTTILQVGFTTICWLIAAFVAPQTERAKLIEFYKKVHPAGPGWTNVRKEAGVTVADAALHGDHMGKATLGWVSGCAVIWSSLFAIGNFLYGRTQPALILTGVFVVSGVVLLWVVNHLWDKNGGDASARAGEQEPKQGNNMRYQTAANAPLADGGQRLCRGHPRAYSAPPKDGVPRRGVQTPTEDAHPDGRRRRATPASTWPSGWAKPRVTTSRSRTSTEAQPAKGAILLTTKDAKPELGAEGYELTVTADSVVVRAGKSAGLFRGRVWLVFLCC